MKTSIILIIKDFQAMAHTILMVKLMEERDLEAEVSLSIQNFSGINR
jgi:hypothetical protein